ncbi:MAG TPA: hypothetical protein VK821_16700 [Dehalococcoidia bacterium]|nr:hypothetical protein [Dehalococcoidia bacterium]
MDSPEPDPRAPTYLPDAVYAQIRDQIQTSPRGRGAGLVACVVFVLAALLLLILLETGTDVQEILLTAIAIAAANLVIGVIWVTASQRSQ